MPTSEKLLNTVGEWNICCIPLFLRNHLLASPFRTWPHFSDLSTTSLSTTQEVWWLFLRAAWICNSQEAHVIYVWTLFWLVTWLLAVMLFLASFSINSKFFWGVILFPCNGMHIYFLGPPWCSVTFLWNLKDDLLCMWLLFYLQILAKVLKLAWYTYFCEPQRYCFTFSKESRKHPGLETFPHSTPTCTPGWCNEMDFSERLCAWLWDFQWSVRYQ